MDIYAAMADQKAAKQGLKASLGKISQAAPRKRAKTYTEKQRQEAIDAAVNAALEEAARLVWTKVGIALGRRQEADWAMVHIKSLKR